MWEDICGLSFNRWLLAASVVVEFAPRPARQPYSMRALSLRLPALGARCRHDHPALDAQANRVKKVYFSQGRTLPCGPYLPPSAYLKSALSDRPGR